MTWLECCYFGLFDVNLKGVEVKNVCFTFNINMFEVFLFCHVQTNESLKTFWWFCQTFNYLICQILSTRVYLPYFVEFL